MKLEDNLQVLYIYPNVYILSLSTCRNIHIYIHIYKHTLVTLEEQRSIIW